MGEENNFLLAPWVREYKEKEKARQTWLLQLAEKYALSVEDSKHPNGHYMNEVIITPLGASLGTVSSDAMLDNLVSTLRESAAKERKLSREMILHIHEGTGEAAKWLAPLVAAPAFITTGGPLMQMLSRPLTTTARVASTVFPKVSRVLPYTLIADRGIMGYLGTTGMYNTGKKWYEGKIPWYQAVPQMGLEGLMAADAVPVVREIPRVVKSTTTALQNNYPALFDPYTSWDATLGYHGNNILSRVVGTFSRRHGYTPKAEIPEFHRRLSITKPESFRLTDDGKFIISSGRTGDGHDGIVNFATSEAARSQRRHKYLSGINDFIIHPKALKGANWKSIQPSDTFLEMPLDNSTLAIDPKYITFVSGEPEALKYARSIGMKTLSSPKLRALEEEPTFSGLKDRLYTWKGAHTERSGSIGKEIQRLTSMRGAPTMKDYAHFEDITGLNSGVVPSSLWTGTNEEALFGRVNGVSGVPTFNNVAYDPATSIESIYRKAKIGEKPWSDYYGALKKMPSARQQLDNTGLTTLEKVTAPLADRTSGVIDLIKYGIKDRILGHKLYNKYLRDNKYSESLIDILGSRNIITDESGMLFMQPATYTRSDLIYTGPYSIRMGFTPKIKGSKLSKDLVSLGKSAIDDLPAGTSISADAHGVSIPSRLSTPRGRKNPTKVLLEGTEDAETTLSRLEKKYGEPFTRNPYDMSADAHRFFTIEALKPGRELVYAGRSGKFNDYAASNPLIYQWQLAYEAGNMSAREYVQNYNNWVKLFNGRPGHIDLYGKPYFYHPTIFVTHKQGGKMNILQFLKNGSGIHIKKENRGKFTDYCGGKVTSECIAKGKRSSNPAIRKRATFAANARKWKHEDGGKVKKHLAFVNGVSILDSNPDAYKYVKKKVAKALEGTNTANWKGFGKTVLEQLPSIVNSVNAQKAARQLVKANEVTDEVAEAEDFLNNLKKLYSNYKAYTNYLTQQAAKNGITINSSNIDADYFAHLLAWNDTLANSLARKAKTQLKNSKILEEGNKLLTDSIMGGIGKIGLAGYNLYASYKANKAANPGQTSTSTTDVTPNYMDAVNTLDNYGYGLA